MLFHVDLFKFNQMVKILQSKKEPLELLFQTVGVLDAMYAVASYRTYLGQDNFSEPVFVNDSLSIEVKGLYHPLVENPVKADFSENKSSGYRF